MNGLSLTTLIMHARIVFLVAGLESTVPTTAPPCERPRKLCPDGRCVTNRRECQPGKDVALNVLKALEGNFYYINS